MNRYLITAGLSILLLYILGCNKNNSSVQNAKPYFIKAKFNNTPWEITKFGQGVFNARLDIFRNRWKIGIGADNGEYDTICRLISFTFDYVPIRGKHYFNNSPLGFLPDSGLIGNYSYYNLISNGWETRYSMDGYIDVKEISRDEIKGDFSFNATAGTSTDSAIIRVTEGSFYLYNPGGGDLWPGP